MALSRMLEDEGGIMKLGRTARIILDHWLISSLWKIEVILPFAPLHKVVLFRSSTSDFAP